MPKNDLVCCNFRFYPRNEVPIPVLNRGLKYGDGLFETIRIRNGKILFETDHQARLLNGLRILGMDPATSHWADRVFDATRSLHKKCDAPAEARARIQVFRAGGGAYEPVQNKPQLLIEVIPLPHDFYGELHQESLCFFEEIKLQFSALSAVKSSNSLPYILAAQHAQARKFDDAVLFCGKNAAETSRSNLFAVIGNQVLTPPLSSGCLPGILRHFVFALCGQAGIKIREKHLRAADLENASDLFTTNVVRGITRIHRIGQHDFPKRPHEYIRKLHELLDLNTV